MVRSIAIIKSTNMRIIVVAITIRTVRSILDAVLC